MDRYLVGVLTKVISLCASTVVLYGAVLSPAESASAELAAPRSPGLGSWSLYCNQSPRAVSDCALAQAVQSENVPELKLALSVSYDEMWNAQFKMRVEPLLAGSEGIALLIDGFQTGTIVPSSCDAQSCTATFAPPSRMMARILGGQELEAEFRTQSSPKGTSIALDLPGLADGLMAMAEKVNFNGKNKWVMSAAGTSEFKVDLVNLKDLPKDKAFDLKTFKQVTSASSAFMQCDVAGAERRPEPVTISVNDMLQFVNFDDKSRIGLKRFADITHRCGDEWAVSMVAEPDDSKSALTWRPLFQIKEAAVENVLAEHGITQSRLLVPDYQAGMVLSRYPSEYIGGWSSPVRAIVNSGQSNIQINNGH
jgi:invasion protein IalB